MPFPNVCGTCAEPRMSFTAAEEFCRVSGGGLCKNNQVTAGGRAVNCGLHRDEMVWTGKVCGGGNGRELRRAYGGTHSCEMNLEAQRHVVCCANTCNGFVPDHIADRPSDA